MPKHLILENISNEELVDHLRQLYVYMKSKLPKIDRDPKIFFKRDAVNADDILGKTGYYDPDSDEIHLYITNRHPKDVLRSFAHELIHHEQNCSGVTEKLDMSKTAEVDYASKDKGLRMVERDAFRRGNMLFRDWTDSLKAKQSKGSEIMGEQKKKKKNPKDVIKDAEESAKKAARDWIRHSTGKDLKDMKKELEESEKTTDTKLDETTGNPYPQLFEPKDRVLQDAFQKREELVFQELVKRFSQE